MTTQTETITFNITVVKHAASGSASWMHQGHSEPLSEFIGRLAMRLAKWNSAEKKEVLAVWLGDDETGFSHQFGDMALQSLNHFCARRLKWEDQNAQLARYAVYGEVERACIALEETRKSVAN